MHNCKNLTYSVAKKHQIWCCFNLLSKNILNTDLEIIKFVDIKLKDITDQDLVSKLYDKTLNIDTNIKINCFLKVFSQLIKPNMLILVKENTFSQIKVAKINEIVQIEQVVYFYCKVMPIKSFDTQYHAFEIVESEEFILINHDQFYHYHPFTELKNLEKQDKGMFIRLGCYISNYLMAS